MVDTRIIHPEADEHRSSSEPGIFPIFYYILINSRYRMLSLILLLLRYYEYSLLTNYPYYIYKTFEFRMTLVSSRILSLNTMDFEQMFHPPGVLNIPGNSPHVLLHPTL